MEPGADLTKPAIRVRWLGRLPYLEAWDLQKALWNGRVEGRADDYLLLVEHPPVYTVGRNGDGANLLVPPESLDDAEFHHVDRGGDITFHGPGQLVGYPILKLSDPKQIVPYVRKLEQVLIDTLCGLWGSKAGARKGLPGSGPSRGRSPRSG